MVNASVRSLVYCYLGMSIFADLAFFYTGWSLAFVVIWLGGSVLIKVLSPRQKPRLTAVAGANE
jgi:hypothetical protein